MIPDLHRGAPGRLSAPNSYIRVQKVDELMCEGFLRVTKLDEPVARQADHQPCSSLINRKIEIGERIAVSEHCLIDGADEYLQLMAVATSVMNTLASN